MVGQYPHRWLHMKKLLTLTVLSVILTGCSDPIATVTVTVTSESNYGTYRVEVIDGCQYLTYGWTLAHKGNCTNKIHIYRLEDK